VGERIGQREEREISAKREKKGDLAKKRRRNGVFFAFDVSSFTTLIS
jgi:hypothetical protein